jgi:hypothetical protein
MILSNTARKELYAFIDYDGLLKCLFQTMPSNKKSQPAAAYFTTHQYIN